MPGPLEAEMKYVQLIYDNPVNRMLFRRRPEPPPAEDEAHEDESGSEPEPPDQPRLASS